MDGRSPGSRPGAARVQESWTVSRRPVTRTMEPNEPTTRGWTGRDPAGQARHRAVPQQVHVIDAAAGGRFRMVGAAFRTELAGMRGPGSRRAVKAEAVAAEPAGGCQAGPARLR